MDNYGILAPNSARWLVEEKPIELSARRAVRSPHAVQWTEAFALQPAYLPPRGGTLTIRRTCPRSWRSAASLARTAQRMGLERSWLVKTVTTAVSAQPMGMAAEQPLSTPALNSEEEQRPGEAFEATILRLDGTTLEQLFRLAGGE